jgi:hypothetical protein
MKKSVPYVVAALLAAPLAATEANLNLKPNWEYVADTVMGGVSTGQIGAIQTEDGTATRLTGQVSLDNNGGFVQMAFDLQPDGSTFDASTYTGIEITLRGNNEAYDLRLRTDELRRPWHSFRTEIIAKPEWQTLRFPFTEFTPHRTEIAFDPAHLRRFGILAIGRVFDADVTVSHIALY